MYRAINDTHRAAGMDENIQILWRKLVYIELSNHVGESTN